MYAQARLYRIQAVFQMKSPIIDSSAHAAENMADVLVQYLEQALKDPLLHIHIHVLQDRFEGGQTCLVPRTRIVGVLT